MVYRYGYLPYRYGHPGYRYGIWADDVGDDGIDPVICHIDMGYLVTLKLGSNILGGWCFGEKWVQNILGGWRLTQHTRVAK